MPGYKQRILLAECGEPIPKASRCHEDFRGSHLACELLKLWTLGHLSAIGLQKLANAALLDGATHPSIASLAALGTFGEFSGNVSRDLKKYVGKNMTFPEPIDIVVPCLNSKL